MIRPVAAMLAAALMLSACGGSGGESRVNSSGRISRRRGWM